jgi:hypothetical protein
MDDFQVRNALACIVVRALGENPTDETKAPSLSSRIKHSLIIEGIFATRSILEVTPG